MKDRDKRRPTRGHLIQASKDQPIRSPNP